MKRMYIIQIPKDTKSYVKIYEHLGNDDFLDVELKDKDLKCLLDYEKWAMIVDFVSSEFKRRAKEEKSKFNKFKIGQNKISRLWGKEILLLCWAIEKAEIDLIYPALVNWNGLSKEERWWLCTATNASSGHYLDDTGWRKAVRYALAENRISDIRLGC
jgi:hypothetical protein